MDTSRSPLEPSGFSRKLAATIIIVYMVVTLIPITWIVATSFKSVDSAIAYPPEVFFDPSLEGYVNLFTNRSRQPQEYLDSLPPPDTWYEELVRSREMVITGPSKFMGRYSNSLIIGFGATFLSVFLGSLAKDPKNTDKKVAPKPIINELEYLPINFEGPVITISLLLTNSSYQVSGGGRESKYSCGCLERLVNKLT